MKIQVELVRAAVGSRMPEFRDKVRALDDAGATGVSLFDHYFITRGFPRTELANIRHACEPMTTLGAVVAISDRLEVGTVVVNAGMVHAAIFLRQFAQLAVFAGGDRVFAGLGAGWNTEEYDAIGLPYPKFAERMDRLEESLRIARQLFENGTASLEGEHVTVRDLPLSPVPDKPPRLLIGGGSDRALQIAGNYADVLDLHAAPARGKHVGSNSGVMHLADSRRRMLTTVDDLVERAAQARAIAEVAGRAKDALSMSVHMNFVLFTSATDMRTAEERICEWAGIPHRPLSDCPYVLLCRDEREMADVLSERRERIGLGQIVLKERMEPFGSEPIDAVRFCTKVAPRLQA